MEVTTKQIRELRSITGMGVMECKRTLEESLGDFNKALSILDEKAKEIAQQKAAREVKFGIVDAYIHNDGRLGVLIEVYCETDFLSTSPDFKEFVKDLMLQIAAEDPQYVCIEEVPAEVLQEVEREALRAAQALGKPDQVVQTIKEGKVQKYLSQICLMEQRFIKDQDISVNGMVRRFIAKSGENIEVRHFTRYQIAE